ncbi:MAG TPA: hydrogenase maturation protease [Azonexus sp.]|nr:hydrogenase maturation protease [Azonexus sp.]
MSAPVVVFAVGNPSRGDDAIGPVLLERLARWLDDQSLAGQFELIEDFQLQIEHALDLQDRPLALFIDAGANTPAPYTFQRIEPATGIAHTTHELAPEAVLQVFRQTEAREPPPAFVLCVRGEAFELGEALTESARTHVEQAFALLTRLCQRAAPAEWQTVAESESLPK